MSGEIEFAGPWFADDNPALVDELRRELASGHVLFGAPVSAVARRRDGDDVLYALEDGSGRVAVVHLTWSAEADPAWPATELFTDLASWAETMRNDKNEHGA